MYNFFYPPPQKATGVSPWMNTGGYLPKLGERRKIAYFGGFRSHEACFRRGHGRKAVELHESW